MTEIQDGFDARLSSIFDQSAPAADPEFTARTMDALPGHAMARPVMLALAALLGALVTGWQFPSFVQFLGTALGGLGAVALDGVGPQALIMALAAAGLMVVTVFLSMRGHIDV